MTLQIREFIVASGTHSPSPCSVVQEMSTPRASPHPGRYPHHYFPRQNRQIAGHVKHAYNASNSYARAIPLMSERKRMSERNRRTM